MRRQEFVLSGILKIREYKEQLALQEYVNETKEDMILASEYEELDYLVQRNFDTLVDKNMNSKEMFSRSRDVFEYVAASKERRVEIEKLRKDIKPKIDGAKEKYNQARLELESIKILSDVHEKKQKKQIIKAKFNEMQEGILCQKQHLK